MQKLTVLFFLSLSFSQILAQNSFNIDLLGKWEDESIPTTSHNRVRYNDVWAYADATGEYAILGSTTSIHFIDIRDPQHPNLINEFAGGDTTTWRDIKTYKDRAYTISDNSEEGMMIFDLSELPNTITKTYHSNEYFKKAHSVFIDEANGRLYIAGSDTMNLGLLVFDIASNKDQPQLLASVFLEGGEYVHDVFVKDNIAYCSHGNNGYYIWDFTDPQNPEIIADSPTFGYNHSSWLTEDGQYAIYAEEIPSGVPLGIFDLQKMQEGEIKIINTFKFPQLTFKDDRNTPHNPFILGDYLYVSYYEDGLVVFDISNPKKVFIVGYYDTRENDIYLGTRGCWGTYPFLASGNILASDTKGGLFVLKLGKAFQQDQAQGFNLYPNPVADRLSIEMVRNEGTEIEFELYSISGILLLNQKLSFIGQHRYILELNDLAAGIYFLKFYEDGQTTMKKFIKTYKN